MKVTRESSGPAEVVLNIALDPEDEEPFVQRSYRRVVGRAKIPGFRPGKAPRAVVERYLGRPALLHEALDFMIPETLDRVLKEQSLQAFSQPDIQVVETEPVSFKAVVPLEPVVDLGEFRSIRLARDPVEVTEAQVAETVERLRYEAAPWEPVSRPVQYGDLLTLNVDGTIDGERVINDRGVDYIPRQDNLLPFPGFSASLLEMEENAEKEFTLTIPEDYGRAAYAGKECHFQVKVLSIKEKKLPELDDEFAKGVGDGYESMEALRAWVRQRLTEEAEAAALRRLEERSLEELLQTASVQASDLMFQRELDLMREDRERLLRNQRLDLETYLRVIGKTEEELLEEMRPRARDRLTRHLVLRKLAQEEGIEVSGEQIDAEVQTMVSNSADSKEQVRRALSTENARESIRASILNRLVMGRLVAIVQGQDGEKAAEPETLSTQSGEPADLPPPDEAG